MIVVDAGPLIALFDGSDRHHEAAVQFVRDTRQPLVTNAPVLAEVCRVLDFSVQAQLDCLRWVEQAIRIVDADFTIYRSATRRVFRNRFR